MATFNGFDGALKFADANDLTGAITDQAVGNLRSFSIEQTQDTVETTNMGSGGSRQYKPGLHTFTISGDVYFDGTDTVQEKLDELVSKTGEEAIATFEAYPSGVATSSNNTKISGSCIITSFSISSSVDGVVEASFAAQGTGNLTFAQIA